MHSSNAWNHNRDSAAIRRDARSVRAFDKKKINMFIFLIIRIVYMRGKHHAEYMVPNRSRTAIVMHARNIFALLVTEETDMTGHLPRIVEIVRKLFQVTLTANVQEVYGTWSCRQSA